MKYVRLCLRSIGRSSQTHQRKVLEVRLQISRVSGEAFRPLSKTETGAHLARLREENYRVDSREDKPTRSKPNPPFITSTLQQAASTRLGFSVKKTMTLAQRLYEAGYITYMRTDSTNLSADAVEAARSLIKSQFGKNYLPNEPRVYSSKEGAQEAHEAIRPSDVMLAPSDISGLEKDADKLYQLIRAQFLACQMTDAEYNSSSIVVKAGAYELRTRGQVMLFDGFLKALPDFMKKEEDVVLPDVKAGEQLKLLKLDPRQHFTKPAPRYSEAALVKELEESIGRPSTYASIISTIQDRGYVRYESQRFTRKKMGDIVTERLVESFDDLMDYSFTANMEEMLDEVACGNKTETVVK